MDFFWINQDQKSFEWFIQLLNDMEEEQQRDEIINKRFLDVHLHFTRDSRNIALQAAIDMLHNKVL